MLDYMTALHLRFKSPSQRSQDLKQKVTILHRQLASRLEKPERKMLLRLIDTNCRLKALILKRDKTQYHQWIPGFTTG